MPSTIRNALPAASAEVQPEVPRRINVAKPASDADARPVITVTAVATADVAADAAADSVVTQTPLDADTGPTIERTAAPRPPAQDPWRGPIPSTLKKLRTHAQKGWRADEHAIGWLRRYNREQQTDPRGHLVLAVIFMNRAWYSDVAAQYAFAYQRAPSSRGDKTMLRNLIRVASLAPTFERAAGLIVGIYGVEAIDAVDHAINSVKDPQERARLEAVRVRIGA
jgi:hypothetical protein